jgi:hypothetical protein
VKRVGVGGLGAVDPGIRRPPLALCYASLKR